MITETKTEEQFTPEIIKDLRKGKVPCPKCASQTVIFAEDKPFIADHMGQSTVMDLMRCLNCAAMFEQFYY